MNRFLSAFVVVCLPFACLTSCSNQQDAVASYSGFKIEKKTLDQHLQSKMQEFNIPGLSIAIINHGEVVYHNTLGVSDVDKQTPVSASTIFEGASISKSVFAFFVMTFVEEGKLDLDKPLFEYMPHPDITNDPAYEKITARMVLSHRSGLPNWREDEEGEILKTQFEPDSGFLYSGEGYQYLAMVLKHIEKTDWTGLEEMFQKRIAEPIGLEHTVFIQTPYTRNHKAEPYDEDGKWIDWHNNYWFQKEDGIFYAPSSIHSEPLDFSKWMIALMNKEILSEESYRELLKRHSSVPFDGFDVSYTLGLLTPHFPFTDIYIHSGNNIGFTSWFALDTEKDWGFILFTNSDNGEQMGQELFLYLLVGPNLTKLYLLLGLVALILLFLLFLAFRFIIRRVRRARHA